MASMAFPVQFIVRHSQFRSINAFPCRISPNLASLKSRSSVSRAPGLDLSPENTENSSPVEFTGNGLRFSERRRDLVKFPVAKAADADGLDIEISNEIPKLNKRSSERFAAVVTGLFFLTWYFLNVIFNVLNKKLYNYFPYPYFVSVAHLLVGVAYCLIGWAAGLPKRAPIDKELWALLTPLSFCHALGHAMSNVSFAAVAVSFTHTVKALEPFFNAAASQFVLGHQIPLSLWLSLAPVVIGVSVASLKELSFNWLGFISAMISNIASTYRSIYAKKAMTAMDSTNLYAYISIMSLVISIPPAVLIEGPQLMQYGFRDAIAKVAANTLERVTPLSHAVGNVLKRVFVIGLSIVVFSNRISTQTGIGTAIAIAGVAIYSFIKANIEEQKKKDAGRHKM